MNANQTIENSQSDNPADRFVYFAEIPSLQEIASYQVALAIRYNDHSRRFIDPIDFSYSPLFKSEHQKYDLPIESLTTPSIFKKMIKNCMEKIEKELCVWLNHFNNVLFGLSRTPFIVCPVDVNWCVWLPNGEIDYLKTGTKMLKSEKLSELQKFLIMCEYCMEDEIKKVSLDALPTEYISDTNYDGDGILFYWIKYLKKSLNEVPLYHYGSPEAAMARNFRRCTRFAVEYFWHRIGIEDQFNLVSERISRRYDTHFECATIERLISAMSWPQQQYLLALKSYQMLINFSLHSRSTRCALWAWNYYKNEMSEEQFVQIIEIIFERWTRDKHPCPALIEIWETADDHLRNFALRTMPNTVIDMCIFRYYSSMDAMEFVIIFFRLISLEERKRIIFEQIHKIKNYSYKLSTLNEILDICLPRPDDRLVFIKSVIYSDGIKYHFFNYLRARDFEKIDSLLEYYFSHDVEGAREFKKKILKTVTFDRDVNIDFVCNVDEWNRYGDYIDQVFLNDPWQALAVKQRLFKLAIKSTLKFRPHFDLHRDILETLKIVESLFAGEESKSIKRELAYRFADSVKTRVYWENEEISDEIYFQRIIDSCLGDDEKAILKFKKIASQDIIFDRIFFRINELYKESGLKADYLQRLLERMDWYLRWYLASDDQVKIFRVKKLNEVFEQLKIFKSISGRKDEQFLDILLKWVFDGDDEQMRKFRLENFQF